MPLDIQAARVVTQAKLFERAVHDRGPWSIRIGDSEEYAVRITTTTGVVFVAHFEPGVEGDTAWLVCQGEEISAKSITVDDGGFALEWKMSIGDPESVSV